MKYFFILLLMISFAFAESVLIVGDSHTVGTFGSTLYKAVGHQNENKVVLEGCWGASPIHWEEGRDCPHYIHRGVDGVHQEKPSEKIPKIDSLIEKHKPSVVVVALGSNLYTKPAEWIKETVGKLIDKITASGSLCIWVGPPDMRARGGEAFKQLVIDLKASMKTCNFIDSAPLTNYPKTDGDGIHYEGEGAVNWAIDVNKKIKITIDSYKKECNDAPMPAGLPKPSELKQKIKK